MSVFADTTPPAPRPGRSRRPSRAVVLAVAGIAVVVVIALVVWLVVNGSDEGGSSLPEGVSIPTAEAAAAVPPDDALEPFYSQQIEWEDCDGAECGTLTVPVDYAAADGETIELALLRVPADGDADERVGSLVVNPGGPGGSGVEYARTAQGVASITVRRHFDIVGFDPRGVGESAPFRCLDDAEQDAFYAADASPDDTAEEQRIAELSAGLAEGCAENGGALGPRMGTVDAARDMDVLRAALGDERLTYLGKSYGTFLGATYADLFPDRAGRLVLDGALDPALTSAEVGAGQAEGFERALAAYVDACLAGETGACPLRGTPEQAVQQVRDLFTRLDGTPLVGADGRQLTEGLASYGVAVTLYDDAAWTVLSQALTQAQNGDPAGLLQLADLYASRNPDGTYADNSGSAIYAVNCLDSPASGGVDAARAAAEESEQDAPTFGRFLAWSGLPCETWPWPVSREQGPIAAEGAPPILVVGTTRDPATPYEWSQALADQLSSGTLLTFDGDGHTAYRRSNDCLDLAVDRYLLGGVLPEPDTTC